MVAIMLYKCRRCGAEVEEKSKEFRDDAHKDVKIGHHAFSILAYAAKDPFSKYMTHRCSNSGNGNTFGLCDLIGLRFEEGEKHE